MQEDKKDAPTHVRVWAAGGVVARRLPGGTTEVLVCHRRSEDLWALPKGTPDGAEEPRETALREVREETGVEAEVMEEAGTIAYSFPQSAVSNPRYHQVEAPNEVIFDKQVHFFLMRPVGGDTSLHDYEFDSVVWLTADEARERLTHKSESGIVEKALALLEGRSGGTS